MTIPAEAFDQRQRWHDHRTMAWHDKFKHPEEMRWIAFWLAAVAGLLALLISGGVSPGKTGVEAGPQGGKVDRHSAPERATMRRPATTRRGEG
jgi:hypothetical protein